MISSGMPSQESEPPKKGQRSICETKYTRVVFGRVVHQALNHLIGRRELKTSALQIIAAPLLQQRPVLLPGVELLLRIGRGPINAATASLPEDIPCIIEDLHEHHQVAGNA